MSMDKEQLEHYRHSLAHLLAAAVMELYPDTKRTIGPAIDDGFYFDFAFSKPISEEDLPKIEEKMRQIMPSWTGFERHEMSADDAKKEYPGNEFKYELIDQFSGEGQTLTFYKSGSYWDLCRGGHSEGIDHADPQSFKLTKLAGAYWRGDEKNPQLTRIYGAAFETKAELDAYLAMLEEAKRRDHRKLGAELDLFAFSPLVGSGLPLFTPKGTIIRKLLEEFVWKLMKPHGYSRVDIPHMAKADLYKTSGHYDKFADDIFHVHSKKSDDEFIMKPMNCPHHTQIYASRPRSYRDLPLRYSEVTKVYRDENTGQLAGLSRVRSITQDDAHIFCTPDQVKDEALKIYDIITKFYTAFDMPLRIRLSVHDPKQPEKYLGTPDVWNNAVATLEGLLKELGKEYELGVGEAAFYGPKIDFIAKDAIGREWQLATIQLDFNLPERFELEYTDSDGIKKRPVMVHRAISGSIERFMSVIIEHYAGAFPLWLAPVQMMLCPVGEAHMEFAHALQAEIDAVGGRAEIDESGDKVGAKIRKVAEQKIPWTLVLGDKEVGGEAFQIRVFGQEAPLVLTRAELMEEIKKYNV